MDYKGTVKVLRIFGSWAKVDNYNKAQENGFGIFLLQIPHNIYLPTLGP